MNRPTVTKFLFILVILTALLMVVPFFIGQLTKSQLTASITIAELENPLFKAAAIEHQVGWLSSKLHYRITEYDDLSNQLLYGLDVNATFFHGLFFLDSPGVGLAKLEGKLAYEHPQLAAPITAPIKIGINLLGHGTAHLSVTGEIPTKAGARLLIDATEIVLGFPVSGSKLRFQAQIGGASLKPGWALGESDFNGELYLSKKQLWLGNLETHVGELRIGRETFGSTSALLSTAELQSQVSYHLVANMAQPASHEFAYGPGELRVQINTLDGDALAELMTIQAAIQEHESPDFARQALMPDIMETLPRLLKHGPTAKIEQLDLETTAGPLSGHFEFDIPAMEGMGLAGLILGQGNARLEISRRLAQHWETHSIFSESWQDINRSGVLRLAQGDYVLDGHFEDKVLTINGRQYGLPMGL